MAADPTARLELVEKSLGVNDRPYAVTSISINIDDCLTNSKQAALLSVLLITLTGYNDVFRILDSIPLLIPLLNLLRRSIVFEIQKTPVLLDRNSLMIFVVELLASLRTTFLMPHWPSAVCCFLPIGASNARLLVTVLFAFDVRPHTGITRDLCHGSSQSSISS